MRVLSVALVFGSLLTYKLCTLVEDQVTTTTKAVSGGYTHKHKRASTTCSYLAFFKERDECCEILVASLIELGEIMPTRALYDVSLRWDTWELFDCNHSVHPTYTHSIYAVLARYNHIDRYRYIQDYVWCAVLCAYTTLYARKQAWA